MLPLFTCKFLIFSHISAQIVVPEKSYNRKWIIIMDAISMWLLPMEIFTTICPAFGLTGNLLMIIVTLRAKNLNTACHRLIGTTCLADFLHQLGQIPFLYGLYTRTQWTTQEQCYLLQPFVAQQCSYRQNQSTTMYFLIHLTAPVAYFAIFAFYAAQYRNDRPAMCAPPEFFDGPSNNLWAEVSVGLNALVVVAYILVYVKLRTSTFSNAARSVFKSLFITVTIVSCGWFATMFTNFMSVMIGATGNTLFLIQAYAGIPVNFAVACNFPVYYTISTEHRNAIRQMLGLAQKGQNKELMTQTNDGSSRRSQSLVVTSQGPQQQFRKTSFSATTVTIC
ncbi:unnamed protein product, partial [Mesorhabditis spiculigera]